MSVSVKPSSRPILEKLPKDGKTWLGFIFWNLINKLIIAFHFRGRIAIEGAANIPASGSFLVIANHSSRWDGPVVQHILNRRANYMVSPNEMRGLQGSAVMSVGAFPAHPRLNPVGYSVQQLHAGEPVVVFPEGNVFYDGVTHPFKTGVAKIVLQCREDQYDLPIVPMFIEYAKDGNRFSAKIRIGKSIVQNDLPVKETNPKEAQRALSLKLYEKVVSLRDGYETVVEECPEEVELRCSA